MNNGKPITAETLLADPDFRDWVRGERPDLEAHWAGWIEQHPDLSFQVEQARVWVLGLSVQHASLTEAKRQEAIKHIMDAVREPVLRPLWYSWRWVAAAGVAGLLCWGGLPIHRSAGSTANKTRRRYVGSAHAAPRSNRSGNDGHGRHPIHSIGRWQCRLPQKRQYAALSAPVYGHPTNGASNG